jgi:hypothetical protein
MRLTLVGAVRSSSLPAFALVRVTMKTLYSTLSAFVCYRVLWFPSVHMFKTTQAMGQSQSAKSNETAGLAAGDKLFHRSIGALTHHARDDAIALCRSRTNETKGNEAAQGKRQRSHASYQFVVLVDGAHLTSGVHTNH